MHVLYRKASLLCIKLDRTVNKLSCSTGTNILFPFSPPVFIFYFHAITLSAQSVRFDITIQLCNV